MTLCEAAPLFVPTFIQMMSNGGSATNIYLSNPLSPGSLAIWGCLRSAGSTPPQEGGTWFEAFQTDPAGAIGGLWWKMTDGSEGSTFSVNGGIPARAVWMIEFGLGGFQAQLNAVNVVHSQTNGGGPGTSFTATGSVTPASLSALLIAWFTANEGNTPAVGPWSSLSSGLTGAGRVPCASDSDIVGDEYANGNAGPRTGAPRGLMAYKRALFSSIQSGSAVGKNGYYNTYWSTGFAAFSIS